MQLMPNCISSPFAVAILEALSGINVEQDETETSDGHYLGQIACFGIIIE